MTELRHRQKDGRKKADEKAAAAALAAAVVVENDTTLADQGRRRRRRSKSSSSSSSSWRLLWGFAAIAGGIYTGQVYRKYRKYGKFAFVDRRLYDMRWNATQWDELLMSSSSSSKEEDGRNDSSLPLPHKQILLLGGPHRGGTTILWKCLARHAEISGFADTFTTGADFSEGISMQTVYPDFGMGREAYLPPEHRHVDMGLGRYALHPDAHLTETDPRVSVSNKVKLLNRLGPFWNLTKPVWMEKSPPTAVMSTFLQALYNVQTTTSSSPTTTTNATYITKFLFITRHPIANAYAHLKADPANRLRLDVDTLMKNYLQLHAYLSHDLAKLRNRPLVLTLEDFGRRPAACLRRVLAWLGVEDDSETAVRAILEAVPVRANVNDEYKTMWCQRLRRRRQQRPSESDNGRDALPRMEQIQEWHHAVRALSPLLDYDILNWCDDDDDYNATATATTEEFD